MEEAAVQWQSLPGQWGRAWPGGLEPPPPAGGPTTLFLSSSSEGLASQPFPWAYMENWRFFLFLFSVLVFVDAGGVQCLMPTDLLSSRNIIIIIICNFPVIRIISFCVGVPRVGFLRVWSHMPGKWTDTERRKISATKIGVHGFLPWCHPKHIV